MNTKLPPMIDVNADTSWLCGTGIFPPGCDFTKLAETLREANLSNANLHSTEAPMIAVARIPLVPAYLSPSERDALSVVQALNDGADTMPNAAPAGCLCNTAEWCARHDRACSCSDRFGRCHAGCDTCLGSAVVGAQEACLPVCKRCAKADSAITGVRTAVRG